MRKIIALLAIGLNLGLAGPVQAGSICREFLLKIQESSERLASPNRPEVSDFAFGKTLIDGSGGAVLASRALSVAQKAGVMVAVFERFFERPLAGAGEIEAIRELALAAGLRDGTLSPQEVFKASRHLIRRFEAGEALEGGLLQRWVNQSYSADVRRSIESGLLRNDEFRGFVEEMIGLEADLPPSRTREKLHATTRNLRSLAQALISDAVLVFLGMPPLAMPNLSFINYSAPNPSAMDVARKTSFMTATNLAVSQLDFWGKVHAGYKSVRKIYLSSLLVFSIGYTTLHPGIITAPIRMYETGWKFHHTSREELKSYEDSTYHPEAVVQEQLDAWQESLDNPPTEQEIIAKRRQLEDQERRGVFKVFR